MPYVDSLAALRLLDPTTYYTGFEVQVGGYAGGADGGGGVFEYDATSTDSDNDGTIVEPANGIGRWYRMYSGSMDIRWFGATDKTGVVDVTAKIQNAITSTPLGGGLFIPVGTFAVSVPLTFTKKITFFGEGWGSIIAPIAAFNAGQDVLVVNQSADADASGYMFRDFAIKPISGTPARHGIYMNESGGGGLNRVTVDHVRVYPLGSYGIFNDGAFSSTIQNCFIANGIKIDELTDNVNILNNTLLGEGYGVYADALAGTNMFNIVGNVIVNKSGGVYIRNAGTVSIENNQFETQAVSDVPLGGYVQLENTDYPGYNVIIRGNNFNINPVHLVRTMLLKNCVQVKIIANAIAGGLPYPASIPIDIRADCYGTVLRDNFYYNNSAPISSFYNSSRILDTVYDATWNTDGRVLDAGFGTVGLWKFLTPAADITENVDYQFLCFKKTEDNIVQVAGGCTVAASADGKVITTLPTGFRTTKRGAFAAAGFNNVAAWSTFGVRQDNAGGLIMVGPPANLVFISFDGGSFRHDYF